jgi:uncharacterized membrane protein
MAVEARAERIGRTASHVLSMLALVWAIVVPLAPIASATGGSLAVGSTIVYAAGSLVCHQRPERSFSTWGRPWPVCARCTGIYLGAGFVAVAGLVPAVRRPLSADAAGWRRRFTVALVAIGATWGLERFGLLDVSAPVRAASGAWLGAVVAAAVVSVRTVPAGHRKDLR